MWNPPKSPYNLIQERLYSDPWKILVACIFCNLTKRIHAEPYFWEILKRWPTPEKLSKADHGLLADLIKPLGLSQRRAKALTRMSYEYIHKDWKDDPTSLYGIGSYGSDAYRIFVLNDWKNTEPSDSALKNYKAWKEEQLLL